MLKRGMGLLGLTALLVLTAPAVRTQASEPGVVTAQSEKVYLEKSIGSTVLANVLQGSTVEIIFTESDDAGGLWFYIRTDTGLEGYLPAQSASKASQQTQIQQETPAQDTDAQQQDAKEQSGAGEQQQDVKEQPDAEEEQTAEKITTLDNVNIRENPTVESKIKGNIPQGTEVSYTKSVRNEQDEVWYAVTYQGIEGYITETAVNAAQLTDEPEEIETEEQTTQTIEATEETESETETITAQPTVSQITTEEIQMTEAQTQEARAESHYGLRLPERFELLLCLGIAACGAILVFLIKKIKRML